MAEALHCPAELVGQGYGLINDCLRDRKDASGRGFECVADCLRGSYKPLPYRKTHSVLSVRSYYDEPGKRRAIYLLFFCYEERKETGIAQQFHKVISA